jgi:hypothetical protein
MVHSLNMASSAAVNVVKLTFPEDLMASVRARAKEENVSVPKFIRGMIRHAMRGDDLSNLHFYQDGSGDTYDVEAIRKMCEQSEAESKAGLTTVCNSDEEVFALLNQWEMESDERKRSGNRVPA